MESVRFAQATWLSTLAFLLLLSGCSNPYRTHFVPSVSDSFAPVEQVDLRRLAPSQYDRLQLDADEVELGRVDFAASFAQPEQALEFAREIGADCVLLNIEYDRTIERTTHYARSSFGLHAGFDRGRTCRRHRARRCRCRDWDYYSYSPAYDVETLPVSIYRHRAVFVRSE